MELFATCPTGFEPLLAQELRNLGLTEVRPLTGQVSCAGSLEQAMRACLWSRLASRMVVVLARGDASNADELYDTLANIAWEDHLGAGTTFVVDATGTNTELRTTQFVALRAKDAIVDRMQHATGARPMVETAHPDLRIMVRISRTRVSAGIDLAGEPLFKRGYERGHRGLRADYAAAMLVCGGWDETEPTSLLLNANADSTALLVEAASMAARQAPGLLRTRWGFFGWAHCDKGLWDSCVSQARETRLGNPGVRLASLGGSVGTLKRALQTAGITAEVQVVDAGSMSKLGSPDLLACDLIAPLDDLSAQARLVSALSLAASTMPKRTSVLARDGIAALALHTDPAQVVTTKLGRDQARISSFETLDTTVPSPINLPSGQAVMPLVTTSDQFAARLKKVARHRARWAKREDITCYRVYDADLPDYAVTLDLFAGTNPSTLASTGERWLYVSEFAAPKEVDPALARCRLLDVLSIAPPLLGVSQNNVFVRVRKHAKGGSQYAAEAKTPASPRKRTSRTQGPALPPGAHIIDEGGLLFEVNFSTRLDCGIFLDHRDTRSMLREMAKQTKGSKRFLNLFAYTGTATCYAADGGMLHTTTVDLSRPSLDWAKRNMERNGFVGREHEYVQADVVRWIQEQRHTRNRWDLVFCDVPTFSNSSRMRSKSFDVQRDHAELLIGLSRLLTRNGTCVFSCNLRTFKPDVQKLERAKVHLEDITQQTIPEDFSRNPRIHHTYLVTRIP